MHWKKYSSFLLEGEREKKKSERKSGCYLVLFVVIFFFFLQSPVLLRVKVWLRECRGNIALVSTKRGRKGNPDQRSFTSGKKRIVIASQNLTRLKQKHQLVDFVPYRYFFQNFQIRPMSSKHNFNQRTLWIWR